MRTKEEQREYQRGYNRALRNSSNRAARAIAIAKGYRARLADMDFARQCKDCARWTRGCPTCHWGMCAANWEFGLEGRMWAEVRRNERDVPRDIITTEEFGCLNWIPRVDAEAAAESAPSLPETP